MDDNRKLDLVCVNFEIPIRLLSGNVKKVVGDTMWGVPRYRWHFDPCEPDEIHHE